MRGDISSLNALTSLQLGLQSMVRQVVIGSLRALTSRVSLDLCCTQATGDLNNRRALTNLQLHSINGTKETGDIGS